MKKFGLLFILLILTLNSYCQIIKDKTQIYVLKAGKDTCYFFYANEMDSVKEYIVVYPGTALVTNANDVNLKNKPFSTNTKTELVKELAKTDYKLSDALKEDADIKTEKEKIK